MYILCYNRSAPAPAVKSAAPNGGGGGNAKELQAAQQQVTQLQEQVNMITIFPLIKAWGVYMYMYCTCIS